MILVLSVREGAVTTQGEPKGGPVRCPPSPTLSWIRFLRGWRQTLSRLPTPAWGVYEWGSLDDVADDLTPLGDARALWTKAWRRRWQDLSIPPPVTPALLSPSPRLSKKDTPFRSNTLLYLSGSRFSWSSRLRNSRVSRGQGGCARGSSCLVLYSYDGGHPRLR